MYYCVRRCYAWPEGQVAQDGRTRAVFLHGSCGCLPEGGLLCCDALTKTQPNAASVEHLTESITREFESLPPKNKNTQHTVGRER